METYFVRITAEETIYYDNTFTVQAESEEAAQEIAQDEFFFDPSTFELNREVTNLCVEIV